MMISDKQTCDKKTQRYFIGAYIPLVLSMSVSGACAQTRMDDEMLAVQTTQRTMFSPVVISDIKTSAIKTDLQQAADVQQSAGEQQLDAEQLARLHTDQINQDNIDATVLTEYGMQKKEADARQLTGEKKVYAPLKVRTVEYGGSAQQNTVRITTEDKIIIYTNRDSGQFK
ncbi:hypothetical protein [Acinetobacter sp. WZC-1]|uniref:hypothetical protein n=1 Tax=Acinetobacter sp. WZC-1 TaxID=3459034 RepID=UPI00403D6A9E